MRTKRQAHAERVRPQDQVRTKCGQTCQATPKQSAKQMRSRRAASADQVSTKCGPSADQAPTMSRLPGGWAGVLPGAVYLART